MSLVLNKRKRIANDTKSVKRPYSVGSCTGTGDEKTYNACKMARPSSIKIDRILL
ncbi:6384_t:CDS:1, partial [Gigaspora rosea]